MRRILRKFEFSAAPTHSPLRARVSSSSLHRSVHAPLLRSLPTLFSSLLLPFHQADHLHQRSFDRLHQADRLHQRPPLLLLSNHLHQRPHLLYYHSEATLTSSLLLPFHQAEQLPPSCSNRNPTENFIFVVPLSSLTASSLHLPFTHPSFFLKSKPQLKPSRSLLT